MQLKKSILILGGAYTAMPLVKCAKERGLKVVLVHNVIKSPCAPFADVHEIVNTLDIQSCINIANKYHVDAVATVGTDQPLYTATVIAENLGLPSFLDVNTAKAATNKKVMRDRFVRTGLPVNKCKYIAKNSDVSMLFDLTLPIVVKPIDSHGSRGVFKLHSYDEAVDVLDEVIKSSYSRESEILVEEYYGETELAIDGIVQDENYFYLGMRKRNNLVFDKKIGFCTSVISPSPEYMDKIREISEICQLVANSLGVKDGPLFVQLLDGVKGYRINEAAARVASGFGCIVNKAINGFDIVEAVIDGALGIRPTIDIQPFSKPMLYSSQIVIAKVGIVDAITPIAEILHMPYVFAAEYYCERGETLCVNGEPFTTAAYVCITGSDYDELASNVSSFYDKFYILNQYGKNVVIRGSIGQLSHEDLKG